MLNLGFEKHSPFKDVDNFRVGLGELSSVLTYIFSFMKRQEKANIMMKWHQSAGVCVHLFVSTEAHTEKAV